MIQVPSIDSIHPAHTAAGVRAYSHHHAEARKTKGGQGIEKAGRCNSAQGSSAEGLLEAFL